MAQYIIIIVSKWITTTDKGPIRPIKDMFDKKGKIEIFVAGNIDKKIIGFTKKEHYGYTDETIKQELMSNKASNKLLLLHTSDPDNYNEADIPRFTGFENTTVDTFGGGFGEIYNHLIDVNGHFKADAIDFETDYHEEWKGIKEDVFNKIWDHYWKACKKKLFELKEDILISLFPSIWNDDMSKVGEIIQKEIDGVSLKQRIENFLEKDCKDLSRKYNFEKCYENLNDTKRIKAYSKLKENLNHLLKDENIPKELLQELRNDFDKLIIKFSGDIY